MVKFSSYLIAAISTLGLAVVVIRPELHLPAPATVVSEVALPDAALAEADTVVSALPVSVVMSTFDLKATDSSQFGDLDQQ